MMRLMIILNLMLSLLNPTQIIYLQPYNSFTQAEARAVKSELDVRFEEIMDRPFEIRILPNRTLSDNMKNRDRTRFRADSILNYEKSYCPDKVMMIGLLHEDISYSNKASDDFGIYGLSYMYGNVVVISTFRTKKDEELWKLIEHEFLHTYYHLDHCEKDDPHCIMQEGHGAPRLNEKEGLCDDCKERIERKKTLFKLGLQNHHAL